MAKNTLTLFLIMSFTFGACVEDAEPKLNEVCVEDTDPILSDVKMKITIGKNELIATLEDNSSTKALKQLLAEKAITIDMSDYGGFEKIGNLGTNLPQNNQQIRTQAGDLILYQGNQLVIFYAPNTWSYTRLGKIENITQQELREVLGTGNITITISLAQ